MQYRLNTLLCRSGSRSIHSSSFSSGTAAISSPVGSGMSSCIQKSHSTTGILLFRRIWSTDIFTAIRSSQLAKEPVPLYVNVPIFPTARTIVSCIKSLASSSSFMYRLQSESTLAAYLLYSSFSANLSLSQQYAARSCSLRSLYTGLSTTSNNYSLLLPPAYTPLKKAIPVPTSRMTNTKGRVA